MIVMLDNMTLENVEAIRGESEIVMRFQTGDPTVDIALRDYSSKVYDLCKDIQFQVKQGVAQDAEYNEAHADDRIPFGAGE